MSQHDGVANASWTLMWPDTGLAMRTNVTHVRTLPKRYPDLNHTHKHTCGLSAVWCGVVWCEVSVIVVWCGVVWRGVVWCGDK